MISDKEEQRRKKISISLIGNKRRLGTEAWNKGKKGLQKHSKEWKKQASKRMKGNKNGFRIGNVAWNKGKDSKKLIKCVSCDKEVKIFASRVKKKNFCSRACSNKRIGKVSANWKGGITPFRIKFWKSTKHKEWRDAVFARDRYICKFCNQRGGELEAHHIKKFSKYPLLRLKVNNGIALCVKCHNKTKGKEEKYDLQCTLLISS